MRFHRVRATLNLIYYFLAKFEPMKPTNGHIPSFGGFGYSRRQRSQEEQYQKQPNFTNNYKANVANISTNSKDESNSKNLIETLLSSADKSMWFKKWEKLKKHDRI
jgi:hypothetical protein